MEVKIEKGLPLQNVSEKKLFLKLKEIFHIEIDFILEKLKKNSIYSPGFQ